MEERGQEILRLNNKIKHLLTLNEKLTINNNQLEKQNKFLINEQKQTKDEKKKISQLNLQYKFDHQKATEDRDNVFQLHQKQKRNYKEIMQKCRKQNEKIQMLERTIETLGNVPYAIVPGQLNSKGASTDNSNNKNLMDQINILQKNIKTLEKDLTAAYEIIDELEFEVEEIDFLESEIHRLRDDITKLKNESNSKQFDNTSQAEVSGEEKSIIQDTCTKLRNRESFRKRLEELHARQSLIDFHKN